jgi:hypothetical protein
MQMPTHAPTVQPTTLPTTAPTAVSMHVDCLGYMGRCYPGPFQYQYKITLTLTSHQSHVRTAAYPRTDNATDGAAYDCSNLGEIAQHYSMVFRSQPG